MADQQETKPGSTSPLSTPNPSPVVPAQATESEETMFEESNDNNNNNNNHNHEQPRHFTHAYISKVSERAIKAHEAYGHAGPVLQSYTPQIQAARDYLASQQELAVAIQTHRAALQERAVRITALTSLTRRWTTRWSQDRQDLDLKSLTISGTAPESALACAAQLVTLAQSGSEAYLAAMIESVDQALARCSEALVLVQASAQVRKEAERKRASLGRQVERFIAGYRACLAAALGETSPVVRGLKLPRKLRRAESEAGEATIGVVNDPPESDDEAATEQDQDAAA